MKKTFPILVVLALVSAASSSVSAEQGPKNPEPAEKTHMESKSRAKIHESVMEVLRSREEFSVFRNAVESARLAELLESGRQMTLFVPTNKAFGEFPEATLTALTDPANDTMAENLLTFHMVRDRLPAKAIESGWVRTFYGKDVRFRAEKDLTMIGSAKIVETDIKAKNGIVHAIDTVLVPPAL